MHGTFYVGTEVPDPSAGTEVPDPSMGTEVPVPSVPRDIWEKKLTFPVYKNILLDIKDIREK